MIVMTQFKGFVVKEIYHIFRDSRTLLILFGMPIVQLILFGFAIRTEINDAEIAILDKSGDHVTSELINKILSSGYFSVKEYLDDESEISSVFARGRVKQVIIFESQFAQRLFRDGMANIQLIADASDPNTASMLVAYASSIIADYQRSMAARLPGGVQPEIKMLYNPSLESVYMFVPGLIALVLMLVSALMTSIAITREKEMGTMEILLVSPLKPAQIIIGKVLPYLALAFIIAISVLAMAWQIFAMPIRGSLGLFLAECTLFIISALALGIFISTKARTQQVAMMVSLAGLLLPTILLSGFIFPIANMPELLQIISNAIPARWFLSIMKGIMLKGVGIEFLWRETLVLVGMTILFLFLSVKNFKIRLQ